MPRSLKQLGLFVLCASLMALAHAGSASALAIYSYTGNNFDSIGDSTPPPGSYTTAMSVTASFQLAAALAASQPLQDISGSVLAYTLNDGVNTFTESDSSILFFSIGTDALGEIDEWQVMVLSAGYSTYALVGDQRGAIRTQSISVARDQGGWEECVASSGSNCTTTSVDTGLVLDNPGSWALVPEPSTAVLVMIGLVGLTGWRRGLRPCGVSL